MEGLNTSSKNFWGILNRSANEGDQSQLEVYEIPQIDLVIVDLYPFEETVKSGLGEEEIIEKIDIGGISLIRAAAKNFNDVTVSKKEHYNELSKIIMENKTPSTNLQ